jgi:serine/threonine protein kinase/WD40 repeat protein/formylglycine-generating enzyme required for sulfatase activity
VIASRCLSDDSLHSLLVGTMSDDDVAVCESHLAECPNCLVRTRSLKTSDTLDNLLSQMKDVEWSREEEAEIERLKPHIADRSQLLARFAMTEGILVSSTPDRTQSSESSPATSPPQAEPAGLTASSLSPAEPTFTTLVSGEQASPSATTHTMVLQPSEGTQLGVYKLEKKLGEGGMGAVWKAFHTKLKKHVALKVLPAHLLRDAKLVSRFEREMEAVGSLDHPAIVRAMDAGEVQGTHYLVMEYVDGQDLGELVKAKGARKVPEACEMIRQAAIGLGYAHKNGLVHRDIKPSNLFLTKDGKVKILDLGLARLQADNLATDPGAGLTGTGQVMGTPDYMAPEQWENTHTVGSACDLYALGCTLFFLLTGRAPFGDEKHQTLPRKMMGHVNDPPPELSAVRSALLARAKKPSGASAAASTQGAALSTLGAESKGVESKPGATPPAVVPAPPHDIPQELEAVYRRLMAKDPKDRYSTADELAAALVPIIKGKKPAASSDPSADFAMGPAPGDAPAPLPTVPSVAESGKSQPPAPPRSKKRLALGGLGAVLLLGVIIITIRHKDGTTTKLEVDDSAEVAVTREKRAASPPAGLQPSTLNPRPAMPKAVPVAEATPTEPAIDFAAERKAAEALIAFQVKHGIGHDKFSIHLASTATRQVSRAPDLAEKLPRDGFTVHTISDASGKLTLDDMALIGSCSHLRDLRLWRETTDEDLRRLRSLKSLTRLTLASDRPGNEAAHLIASNPNLENLVLGEMPQLSPAALAAALRECPRMRNLDLAASSCSSELYKTLGEHCRELRSLIVHEPHGVDLPSLASLPRLRELRITGEHFAPERAEASIAALKSLSSLEDLQFEPPGSNEGLRHLVPLAKKLRSLTVMGWYDWDSGVSSPGWKTLEEFTTLEKLWIGGQRSSLDGPTLLRLAKLPKLKELTLSFAGGGQQYTATDVAEVRRLRPDLLLTAAVGKDQKTFPALEYYPRGADGRSLAEWKLPEGAPAPAVVPFTPEEAKAHQEAWAKFTKQPVEVENSLGMKFRLIPPLEFVTQEERKHEIARVEPPFYLGTTEVTWNQFRQFVEATSYKTEAERLGNGISQDKDKHPVGTWRTPGFDTPPDTPVTIVCRADIRAFCDWLGENDKAIYRLPSELEWEAAARGGGAEDWGWCADRSMALAVGWFLDGLPPGAPKSPQPVGQKVANPFGLHDVLGNVCELCAESWEGRPTLEHLPVSLRGGSIFDPDPSVLRSPWTGDWRQYNVGFRVLRELPGAKPLPKPFEGPVMVRPSRPLSVTAAVSRPEHIPGLHSWSVEMASHHGLNLMAIAWSPRGDLIATAYDRDAGIRLWDREGKLQRVLLGHPGLINSVSFSHDGKLLASGESMQNEASTSSTVRVWDVATGTTRAVLTSPGWFWSVAFAPDRYQIAYWSQGGLSVADLTAGTTRFLSGPSFQGLAWSADGRSLVTAEHGVSLAVWDANGSRPPDLLKVDDPAAGTFSSAMAWSPDNKVIAEWRWDRKLRLWDAGTRQKIRDIPTSHSEVGRVSWSRDNRRILLGGGREPAWTLIDSANGQTLVEAEKGSPSYQAAWSPDEREVVGWNHDGLGHLVFYDSTTGKIVRRGSTNGRALPVDLESISPDGRAIALTRGPQLRQFDAESGRLERDKTSALLGEVATWSPDGKRLAIPSWGALAELAIMNSDSAERLQTLRVADSKPEERVFNRVGWSPDGRQVVTSDDDGKVRLWNVGEGRLVRELTGHQGRVWNVAWSPDGTKIASCGVDKSVRIWEAEKGDLLHSLTEFPDDLLGYFPGGWSTHNLAWTPDSRSLWIGLKWKAARFDLVGRRFESLESLSNGGLLNSLSLSPDGTKLLGREGYGWTVLRDLEKPETRNLRQHLGWHPIWLPDSRRFVGSEKSQSAIRGFDTRVDQRLGTLYPWVGSDGKDGQWLCVGPTGHYRGSAKIDEHIVYVAMHDDGSQVTYTPAEFREKFGWKNDPEKATLLALPGNTLRSPEGGVSKGASNVGQPIDYAAERKAAEFALGRSFQPMALVDSGGKPIDWDGKTLPGGPFAIRSLFLTSQEGKPLDDAAIEPFAGCRQIADLHLLKGTVTGRGLSRLLPNLPLNSLALHQTRIGREEMHAIVRDSRASLLILFECQYADESWDRLPESKAILAINIYASVPSEAQCRQLAACTRLDSLGLYKLARLSPQVLEGLVSGRPLTVLYLNVTDLKSEKTLQGLRGCPRLRYLAIPGAGFDETVVEAVDNLPALSSLYLGYESHVDPNELPHLRRLTRLKLLELKGQKPETISTALTAVSQVPNLTEVYLDDFGGTDDDFHQLAQLPKLLTLHLSRPKIDKEFETRLTKWQSDRPWFDVRLNGKLTFYGVDLAAERRAAEWLAKNIKSGYAGLIREDGSRVQLGATQRSVPDGKLIVLDLHADCGEADDAQIESLAGCRRLRIFDLYGSKVTAEGLHWLGANRGLKSLTIPDRPLLDPKFFAQLENLTVLEDLSLAGSTGELASFRALPRLPSLRRLEIPGIPLKDEHFPDLSSQCPNLREIVMQHQGAQPESVKPLEGHPTIETIQCDSTHLTPQGLVALKSIPKLKGLGIHSPLAHSPLRRVTELSDRLTTLWLYTWFDWDAGPTDADYDALLAMPNLEEIDLGKHRGSPSDNHLERTAKLPKLRTLRMDFDADKRRYTPEGIEKFRKARPDVHLEVDGKAYPAAKVE